MCMYRFTYTYIFVCVCVYKYIYIVCVYVKAYTVLVKVDIWERARDGASPSHTSSSPIEQSLVKLYYIIV